MVIDLKIRVQSDRRQAATSLIECIVRRCGARWQLVALHRCKLILVSAFSDTKDILCPVRRVESSERALYIRLALFCGEVLCRVGLGLDDAVGLRGAIKVTVHDGFALHVAVAFAGTLICADLLMHLHIEPLHLVLLLLLDRLGNAMRLKHKARAELQQLFFLLLQGLLQLHWLVASSTLLYQFLYFVHVQ